MDWNEEQGIGERALAKPDLRDEVIADAFAWLRKYGHIDNHGHRNETSACAECKIVNRLEALSTPKAPR